MSERGDVVWSGGRSWQRDEDVGSPNDKNWWYSPIDTDGSGVLLADLKQHDDFEWLVHNGKRCDLPIHVEHVCCPHCENTAHAPHSDVAAEEWQEQCQQLRKEREHQNLRWAHLATVTRTQAPGIGLAQQERNELRDQLVNALTKLAARTEERDYYQELVDAAMASRDDYASLYTDEVTKRKNPGGAPPPTYADGREEERGAGTPMALDKQRGLLAEALTDMVIQHTHRQDDGTYVHSFMSADEGAFDVLVQCGLAEWTGAGKATIRLRDDDKRT